MNIDEAIEIATSTAITLTKLEMAEIAEMLAKEVERLREKLEMAIKEFAENHEDERVRIIYRKLCEARSKSAKWCEEVEKLKEENKQLRLGWCKESEKRQGEWHSESAKTPIKIAAIGDTLCHHCNGVGKMEVRLLDTIPYQWVWAVCPRCAGKGHL